MKDSNLLRYVEIHYDDEAIELGPKIIGQFTYENLEAEIKASIPDVVGDTTSLHISYQHENGYSIRIVQDVGLNLAMTQKLDEPLQLWLRVDPKNSNRKCFQYQLTELQAQVENLKQIIIGMKKNDKHKEKGTKDSGGLKQSDLQTSSLHTNDSRFNCYHSPNPMQYQPITPMHYYPPPISSVYPHTMNYLTNSLPFYRSHPPSLPYSMPPPINSYRPTSTVSNSNPYQIQNMQNTGPTLPPTTMNHIELTNLDAGQSSEPKTMMEKIQSPSEPSTKNSSTPPTEANNSNLSTQPSSDAQNQSPLHNASESTSQATNSSMSQVQNTPLPAPLPPPPPPPPMANPALVKPTAFEAIQANTTRLLLEQQQKMQLQRLQLQMQLQMHQQRGPYFISEASTSMHPTPGSRFPPVIHHYEEPTPIISVPNTPRSSESQFSSTQNSFVTTTLTTKQNTSTPITENISVTSSAPSIQQKMPTQNVQNVSPPITPRTSIIQNASPPITPRTSVQNTSSPRIESTTFKNASPLTAQSTPEQVQNPSASEQNSGIQQTAILETPVLSITQTDKDQETTNSSSSKQSTQDNSVPMKRTHPLLPPVMVPIISKPDESESKKELRRPSFLSQQLHQLVPATVTPLIPPKEREEKEEKDLSPMPMRGAQYPPLFINLPRRSDANLPMQSASARSGTSVLSTGEGAGYSTNVQLPLIQSVLNPSIPSSRYVSKPPTRTHFQQSTTPTPTSYYSKALEAGVQDDTFMHYWYCPLPSEEESRIAPIPKLSILDPTTSSSSAPKPKSSATFYSAKPKTFSGETDKTAFSGSSLRERSTMEQKETFMYDQTKLLGLLEKNIDQLRNFMVK